MCDSHFMHILNSVNYLLQVTAGLKLVKFLFLDNEFEQFSPFGIFHKQEYLLVCLYYLVQLNDVGMPQHFQDLQLPSHSNAV